MRFLAFWSVFAVLSVVCASGPVTAPADAPRAEKRPVRLENHEHVLLDVNEVAQGQRYTSCSSPEVSDDTHLMVYGCDLQGRRFYTLRVKDLRTGADLGVEIRDVTANVVWAADNQHFFYVRQDPKT